MPRIRICALFLLFLATVLAAALPIRSPAHTAERPPQRNQTTERTSEKPAATAPEHYNPAMAENGVAAAAMGRFGTRITAAVAAQQQHKQKNVFISPLSLFMALAMTENGSAGRTRTAMREAMQVPADVGEELLHESASALLKTLRAQTGIKVLIANALWVNEGLTLAPDFVKRSDRLYDAQATTLNLRGPAGVETINAWVKQKTLGKIPGIVGSDDLRNALLVLTNALYFRGTWRYQFEKGQTQQQIFHLANGSGKTVAMMHRSSIPGAYRHGDGYEAAALPYEDSEALLYAVLPGPGKSPEETLANITVEELRAASEPAMLDLRLPRFELEFFASMNEPLTAAGMGIAFNDAPDFTPMGLGDLVISQVLHKTRLEVNEEGTVGAAATAVVTSRAAVLNPAGRKTLVFDRPFALLLVDLKTGAVLFTGVVYDPAP